MTEKKTTSSTSENVSDEFDSKVDEAKLIKVTTQTDTGEPEKISVKRKPSRRSARKKSRRTSPKTIKTETVPDEIDEFPPFSVLDRELCETIAGMIPFGILASVTKDNRYVATDMEKRMLAKHWDKVINKYVPDMVAEYAPEFSLLATIAGLVIQKSGIFEGIVPDAK